MTQSTVLITGATGFLGRRTVEMLLDQGFSVRALVRTTAKASILPQSGVEIARGDVTDSESLKLAFEGIDYVIHAATDTSGTEEGARQVTIGGTKNILDLCASNKIKKLVYISSCSVYGPADYEEGQVIDENAPLERFPEKRGIYSWAKLEAEKLVQEAMDQGRIAAVCLRPGTIYGPGGENFSPTIGFSIKNKVFVVINKHEFILPLVYVDNLVEAVIKAMVSDKSSGRVYNVVDPEQVDKKKYMNVFIRSMYPGAWVLYLPYGLISAVIALQEQVFRVLGRKPVLSAYRLISAKRPIIFDSSRISRDLGWQPSSFEDGVKKTVLPENERHG